MKNMFNVTTILPHNLLQTNPFIRQNFSTQGFRKRAAQLHYVVPELRYVFWPFLASKGGQKRLWGKMVVILNVFFIRNNFPAYED